MQSVELFSTQGYRLEVRVSAICSSPHKRMYFQLLERHEDQLKCRVEVQLFLNKLI